METQSLVYELPHKDSDFKIEWITDPHIGDRNFDEKKYTRRMEVIMDDPQTVMGIGGDNWDCIFGQGTDPRYKADHCADKLDTLAAQQTEWERLTRDVLDEHQRFLDKFKVPKIIGMHWGNHEWNSHLLTTSDMKKYCKRFRLKWMAARCMTQLKLTYKGETLMKKHIYSAHGTGGGKNAMKALNDMSNSVYADIFIMGHLHRLEAKKHLVQFWNDKKDRLDFKRVLKINAGCFTDSVGIGKESWLEHKKNDLELSETGSATVSFNAYKDEITYSM